MKWTTLFFTWLMLLSVNAYGQEDVVKIAVIDTGWDYKSTWPNIDAQKNEQGMPIKKPKLCPSGHIDFTGTGLQDRHGHGTHVASLIATYTNRIDYCLVIIKNYDSKDESFENTTVSAFKHAVNLNVDIIHYSGGGEGFIYEEYEVIKEALDKGIIIVTAAGNHNPKIDKGPRRIDMIIDHVEKRTTESGPAEITVRYIDNLTLETSLGIRLGYYPANYDKRIIAVQNINKEGKLDKSSRFGAAYLYKEMGVDVLSLGLDNRYTYMTGTSQAAPKITAKIINGFKNK